MALTKTSIVDQITVNQYGILSIRTNTIITDGTTEIAQSFLRTLLNPDDSLEGQPANVVTIANAVWTPTVISNYQKMINSSNNKPLVNA